MVIKILQTLTISSNEIKLRFSKSKWPGRKEVNKIDSKVQIIFNEIKSKAFTYFQKSKIINYLKGKLVNDSIFRKVQTQRQ